jgi:hypothetical protein
VFSSGYSMSSSLIHINKEHQGQVRTFVAMRESSLGFGSGATRSKQPVI